MLATQPASIKLLICELFRYYIAMVHPQIFSTVKISYPTVSHILFKGIQYVYQPHSQASFKWTWEYDTSMCTCYCTKMWLN